VHRQSRIADASQLEFRMVHRSGMTGRFGCYAASDIGGQNDDSLNRSLVSPAADGRSTASPSRRSPLAGITPIWAGGANRKLACVSANCGNSDRREFPNPTLQPRAGSRVGVLKKATTGPRWEPRDAVS
jgi:hypothetical protein